MARPKTYLDRLRAFYDLHLRSMEFGNAVADVILVPILALNLIGAITIRDHYLAVILATVAFVDVSSTAILLVAGYLGHGRPRVACAHCQGVMIPTISVWTCQDCGAKLTPPQAGSEPVTAS
jgi:hypothetical protein